MALDKKFIGQCASLGRTLKDRLFLALFGLATLREDPSERKWWPAFSSLIPHLWLSPKQLKGLQLLIDPTDWSQSIIFQEIFLKNSYDLDKVTFVPDVILDCGAHIGMFSLLAKSKFPNTHLIAYEPNLKNVRLIRQHIVTNKLDIKLVQSAISTESKDLYFKAVNSHGGRLLHTESIAGSYKVSAVDFPAAVREINPVSLLLKMDVEGEELVILPKLVPILPKQSAMFFETHSGRDGWHEIETLLVSYGFRVVQLNARGIYCDGFACRD